MALNKYNNIIEELRHELQANADEKTKESGLRFFRESVDLYGVKSALVGKIGKDFYKRVSGCSKEEIFELCEVLWTSGRMEESFIACNWSYAVRDQFNKDDFSVFEEWVNQYVSNWASCDTLCNHTVGAIVDKYPVLLSDLKRWAHSSNRWVKRASAVSLIIPGRQGRYLTDIFEISDILLLDKDDMVQKGYGWMLKEASKPHQTEVFEYVMKHKQIMPRTSLRYAIEKMSPELKREAMKK